MTWLTFLFHTSAVVQITANIIVMFYVFPAFRRTKHRAFLLIWCACLLGTFDTVCDHTIGLEAMQHTQYVAFRTLRRLTYFTSVGLDAAGIVWLTQSFLQRFSIPSPNSPPNA